MAKPVRSVAGPLHLSHLSEPVLRRLSELLDRAAPGKGWRDLAQRAGSRGRVRLSPLDLEQCSLKVLEPKGSPSWSLLKLLGERGCTVVELVEFLQALEHTEALQCLSYPGIEVVVHPDSQAVLSGQVVKLCCWAVGHPFVHYQWFKQEKEVPHGKAPELVLNPVTIHDSGFYICRVNRDSSFAFSRWARLDVCDLQSTPDGNLMASPENKLRICVQPRPQTLTVGDALVLECGAAGNPVPHYQWFRNGFPLENGDKNVYMVTSVDEEHQGTYWCHASNEQEGRDSQKIEVVVGRKAVAVECTEGDLSDLQAADLQEESDHRPVATDKVALLIGNMSYRHHPQLKAPMVDVYELTNLLRQLDFKVVSLLDLTESEMRNAVCCTMLATATRTMGTVSWFPLMLQTPTGLPTACVCRTSSDGCRRKRQDSTFSSWICVAKDMGRCHLTEGKQALEIRSSLSEKRALTDPIQQTLASAGSLARNLQWAKAHELPESKCLEFRCGVQVQLGFAAEFSNVMVIYTRLVQKPPEIAACRAYITDFALDLDVDPKETNKGTPEETGSYLLLKDLPKHCLYTRLSSLQKLKEHLIFTVCLHYEYSGIEEMMDERKEVNVGKPLVAKLGLHHRFKANSCLQSCCTADSPCLNQRETSSVTNKHCALSPCQPASCPGVCHPHPSCSDSIRRPEACSCNGSSKILPSRQEAQNYSPPVDVSNVPVETTDDTAELEFLLSDHFRLSQRQQL
ncbi:mucosa-associated lymphoid tissue lymphoma translocation protein 1 isoform X4 [Pogoniulus pusillus]|uniref:mucosa-associated lymphoid tissue lymphoma translocation protein 1 isoform X4 n=1 Tax=Pogoniulus pusillus TaxID=488313 RepID=UPI0030B93BE9